MKRSRFTDSQIMAVLKQAEAGTPVPDLCREHGDVLQVPGQVRRHGRVADGQDEGARRREPPLEENVR